MPTIPQPRSDRRPSGSLTTASLERLIKPSARPVLHLLDLAGKVELEVGLMWWRQAVAPHHRQPAPARPHEPPVHPANHPAMARQENVTALLTEILTHASDADLQTFIGAAGELISSTQDRRVSVPTALRRFTAHGQQLSRRPAQADPPRPNSGRQRAAQLGSNSAPTQCPSPDPTQQPRPAPRTTPPPASTKRRTR